VRLEFIGYTVVTLAALFSVLGRGSVNPGLAGLAMSYSLSLTALLNFAVRQSAEVENQLVSVERVIEYTSLPEEGPTRTDLIVPESWPSEGRIVCQNVSMRYRPGLPLVLKNISFTVRPKEKVGIVGRTGSGKTSIVQALFRMTEVATDNNGCGGCIIIDDVNIRRLGLDIERSRLGIIPQDPVLFTGSVRTNVDPTGAFTDQEIWYTLESVQLKQAIEVLPMKLDTPVVEFGENFSVGQRQLLCMVRALLKKSKIIVMDEATAAVDMQTDALIQHTIRSEFANMTVLTIAHRIHTIMDYDRVIVMEDGHIVEFDSPSQLLQNCHSMFYALVQESQH